MIKKDYLKQFQNIKNYYNSIDSPKYRNLKINSFSEYYKLLLEIKDHMKNSQEYNNLLNAMTQIMNKFISNSSWINTSERGINKSICPIQKKGNQTFEVPHAWLDRKSKQVCYINNGYWGARNYMVMDVLGYIFLLKEGNDKMPAVCKPIFNDLDEIYSREEDINQNHSVYTKDAIQIGSRENIIDKIKNTKYRIKFSDKDFRKFTSLNLSSKQIFDLLLSTSRVEFKLSFPVRLHSDSGDPKEYRYKMNCYSRFFEMSTIEKSRQDGIISSREYIIVFSTLLGELFVNNLITHNYDRISCAFYKLPELAQLFYRCLLIHHNFKTQQVNLSKIKEVLNLKDKNITNLISTIESNALRPLVKHGLIDDYKKEEGLDGLKYSIFRNKKVSALKLMPPEENVFDKSTKGNRGCVKL